MVQDLVVGLQFVERDATLVRAIGMAIGTVFIQ